MSISPRPLGSACSEPIKKRLEAFNAQALELSRERSAIETDFRKLLDDAYARADGAARLRFRADTLRERSLQCDLDELALFNELPELEALAQAGWLAEAQRLRSDLESHLRGLNAVADEMELDEHSAPRTHLVDYDSLHVSQQRALEHAERMANTPLAEKADALRLSQIQASILAALR